MSTIYTSGTNVPYLEVERRLSPQLKSPLGHGVLIRLEHPACRDSGEIILSANGAPQLEQLIRKARLGGETDRPEPYETRDT